MKTIPTREDIKLQDTWDLDILFQSREAWEKERQAVLALLPKLVAYENTLKEDSDYILSLLQHYWDFSEKINKVAVYAYLQYYADGSSTTNQEMVGMVGHMSSQISQALAFLDEELTSLSKEFFETMLNDERFKDYTQQLLRLQRSKSHILSKQEEKLLARQSEYKRGAQKSFEALTDIDMNFGTIDTPEGAVALSHATFGVLLEHKDREVRKNAYNQFLAEFNEHTNVLSNLYTMSVQQDNADADIRHYKDALDSELYEDNIPLSLYTHLIDITHSRLPVLYKYYELVKKQLQLEDCALYDLSVSPYPAPKHNMPYEEAVNLLYKALAPLGSDYIEILRKGLLEDRWVDRYENKGKRSGAFSMGVYGAYPYILLNYQPESLRQVFTLAHEAGHSMHSYFASEANPYSQHDYTIFEAEVASTVNEFLLYRYLIDTTEDIATKTYLLWHELHDFISTFFRQTMFAEFEKIVHDHANEGKPLTTQFYTDVFLKLYNQYTGPAIHVPESSGIVGLRIPHFYRSYYVYQYATGIAAAVNIGSNIFNKKEGALEGYYNFLRSGNSRFPTDALALAGVDYSNTTVIEYALDEFERKYKELASLST